MCHVYVCTLTWKLGLSSVKQRSESKSDDCSFDFFHANPCLPSITATTNLSPSFWLRKPAFVGSKQKEQPVVPPCSGKSLLSGVSIKNTAEAL